MVSLLPIDLGFDPRVHRDMVVSIDVEEARRDGVRYLDAEGIERTLAPGTDAGEMGRRLRAAGYRIAWDWPLPDGWSGRVVTLRSGEPVLELIDPNDGLPDSPKTRYQYLAAASGLVFRRRLPPAEHGDTWAGETEPPAWEDVDLSALTRPHAVLAFADAVSGRITGGVR
jgi:hypothetical protein